MLISKYVKFIPNDYVSFQTESLMFFDYVKE